MTSKSFDVSDRASAVASASGRQFDVVVVGGGITGAGVLRDAAMRGLSCLLVEKGDFASGTSSATSKMIHGGLRYLATADFSVVRLSSSERDTLASKNPNLVRPLPFLLCSVPGGLPAWKLRAALSLYDLLAWKGNHERFRLISPKEAIRMCPALEGAGVRAAGLYWDSQVDDARLVLEVIKSARRFGGEALNYVEAVGFGTDERGRIDRVSLSDSVGGRKLDVAARCVVNAAGPSAERVRELATHSDSGRMRPAKGVHIVISRDRLPCDSAVAFIGHDGRHMFIVPFGDMVLVGTTDTFTEEIDSPLPREVDCEYLLEAANHAFPSARLVESDVVSTFAGVRPLIAGPEETRPPSALSREHRIDEDVKGMITVAGGKLTTFRAMAESIVDIAIRQLPAERKAALLPCSTADVPLRDDSFDRAALETDICERYGLPAKCASHLAMAWGSAALSLLDSAPAELQSQIGSSRFVLAEVPWSWAHDCPTSLCDLLERRVRMAVLAEGQGLRELDLIVRILGDVAGWDRARRSKESREYRAVVARRYRAASTTDD